VSSIIWDIVAPVSIRSRSWDCLLPGRRDGNGAAGGTTFEAAPALDAILVVAGVDVLTTRFTAALETGGVGPVGFDVGLDATGLVMDLAGFLVGILCSYGSAATVAAVGAVTLYQGNTSSHLKNLLEDSRVSGVFATLE